MTLTITTAAISGWVAKLLVTLVAALIGSVIGRHQERVRVIRERAAWLGYDSPCDVFDEDDLEPGHDSSKNPMCIRCGFRWNNHSPDNEAMKAAMSNNLTYHREPDSAGAVPESVGTNGHTPVPVAILPSETTPVEIPRSRKVRT